MTQPTVIANQTVATPKETVVHAKRALTLPPNAHPQVSGAYDYVGGSRAAALFGVSPWFSKRGLAVKISSGDDNERNNEKVTEIMRIGVALEYAIFQHGCDEFNASPVYHADAPQTEQPLHLTCAAIGVAGTPDAIVMRDDEQPILIEIKNTSQWEWERVPPQYEIQVQTYLLLTGMQHAELWALHAGARMSRWEITADPQQHADIINAVSELHSQLDAGSLPAPVTEADYKHAMGEYHKRSIPNKEGTIRNPELARTARLYLDIKQQKNLQNKEAERQLRENAAILAKAMGDNETLYIDEGDGNVVTIKHKITQRKGYTVEPKEFRAFSVSDKKPKRAEF